MGAGRSFFALLERELVPAPALALAAQALAAQALAAAGTTTRMLSQSHCSSAKTPAPTKS